MYQPKTISTKELITDGKYPVYGANGQIGFYNSFNHEESEVTVTCRGATCGTVNVIPGKSWITGNAMVVRPVDECMSKNLLQYLLNSLDFTNVITGTAQPQITRTTLTTIQVVVPTPKEQEHIVEILEEQFSRLDAALASVRAVREKAARFRRSLLHAAFNGALTGHETSMGVLPDGWSAQSLSLAAEVVMGQSPPGTSYNEDGVGAPFFQGKAEFGQMYPTVRKWTTTGNKHAKVGDILLSVRAPVGPTNVANIDCVIGRGLAAIRAKNHMNQVFLLWFLRSFEHEIAAKGTGTTFDSISGDALRNQLINVPPLAEQEKIVEILEEQLSRLDASLSVVDEIEFRTAALRRSLLHAAFTGNLTKEWRENSHV
jgi:type I restriction enzyme S subunit